MKSLPSLASALRPGIGRDTLLNLLGQTLPLGVAVFAVPALISALGTERFGILALAWTVLGSFSVLDVALGRAVTKLSAEALGRGEPGRLPAIVWNAVLLQAVLGCLVALLFAATAPWLVDRVLHLHGPIAEETRRTFLILALSFPLTLITGCLRSLLEALRRFDLINLVRAPAGAATFALPWLAVHLGWGLPAMVGLLVLFRGMVTAVHYLLCRKALPAMAGWRRPQRSVLSELARFGGWVTAANSVPPLLVLMDRFLIGSLLSLTAVSWFSVPYEMVFRLWVLPTSVVAAAFPVLSMEIGRGDWRRAGEVASRSARMVFLLLGPPVAVAILGAQPILEVWLGGDFAEAGTPVLRWLAAGVLISALGSVPSSVLQAAGRPGLTARLRLIELPVFALLMAGAIRGWGTTGAAVVFAVRAAVDAAVLSWLARRMVQDRREGTGAESR
ncbi:MAG TPA: flippase [Thermoanaerobaculia bacterium]|nr:flippase [Thermoanaerobaculia bacterium]